MVRRNGRMAARLYQERFLNLCLPWHRMFTSSHQRLRDTDSLSASRMAVGRPGQIRPENEEERLQHFRENLRTGIRAAPNQLRITSHSEVWRVLCGNRLHPYRFLRV